MIVTGIKKASRGKCLIEFDEDISLLLSLRAVQDKGILTGEEIDEAALEELIEYSDLCEAKNRALRLLNQRAYSERRLKEKLCEHCDEHIADQTVKEMRRLGLVDDEKYAAALAEELSQYRGYAVFRIVAELVKRGVSRDNAENAAEELEMSDKENIKRLIKGRFAKYTDSGNDGRELTDALSRLGYSYSDIICALREYIEE